MSTTGKTPRAALVFCVALAVSACASVGAGPGGDVDGGARVDAGQRVDGGAARDGGTASDGGVASDGGATEDGGARVDAGAPADGGPVMDAGAPDGGTLPECAGSEATTGVNLQPVAQPLVEGGLVDLRVEAFGPAGPNRDATLVVRLVNVTVESSPAPTLDNGALPSASRVRNDELRVPLQLSGATRRVLRAKLRAVSRSSLVLAMATLEDATSACALPRSSAAGAVQLLGGDSKYLPCFNLGRVTSIEALPRVELASTNIYQMRNGVRSDLDVTRFFSDTEDMKIVHTTSVCVIRPAGRRVQLAGMFDRSLAWAVDDFLLVEAFDAMGQPTGARASSFVYRGCTPCFERLASGARTGQYIPRMGRPTATFAQAGVTTTVALGNRGYQAGEVDVSDLLPADTPMALRMTALDVGVEGGISSVYFVTSPHDGSPIAPYVEPTLDACPPPTTGTCSVP